LPKRATGYLFENTVYDDTAQHAAAIADLFWEEVMRIVGRVVLVSVLLFIVRGGHGAAAFQNGTDPNSCWF